MKNISTYKIFERKSKRKIGSFAKHCMNLGYSGAKKGRCYGKKKKESEIKQMDFGKDYYYDLKEGKKEDFFNQVIDSIQDILDKYDIYSYDEGDDGYDPPEDSPYWEFSYDSPNANANLQINISNMKMSLASKVFKDINDRHDNIESFVGYPIRTIKNLNDRNGTDNYIIITKLKK